MRRHAAILSMLVFWAACSRPAPQSRITSVEARIDGITCPTCVPPLTASLKRQYGKSAIEVDDDKDTASIRFAEDEDFSASDLRVAVERVRMRVVTLRMQVCGTVETRNGDKWLTAGSHRFLVHSDRELPLNEPLCADGTLDASSTPETFQVSAFSVQAASGS
jgi:copper chaperone CopZ